jgi:hypothetical protein
LTQKLLNRPHLISHIRSLIPDLDRAHMVPFNTTGMERRLAVQLGIPMYAADPSYIAFGSRAAAGASFPKSAYRIHWAGRICFPKRPS